MTYNHITSISSLPFLFWQRFLNWLGLAVVIEIVVIALLFVVGFLVSEHFRTTGNVADIFEQMTGLAFVALGQTVVIITGGIDLSLDATIALTSSLLSGVVNGRADLAAPMIVAVLAIGITIGLVNGALILALRVHPLIITLAVAAVIQGFALLYTLMPIGSMPDGFDAFAFERLFGIPIGAIVAVLLFGLVGFILIYTRLGRRIFALGGEPIAARLVGIPVNWVVLFVYGLSGLCASLTGIYLVSRLGIGNPTGDTNFNLASITPVILGGTPLTGGRGGVLGTLLGVLLVQTLNNVLNFLDVSTFYQWMISGSDRNCGGIDLRRKAQAGSMSTTVLAKPKLVSHRVSRVVERNGLLLFCLLLTAGAAIFAPGFRSPNNLQNVLTNAAPLGVVVLGQCLVILVRGFDLSVASVMATAAVVATSFDYSTDWSVIPILAVSLVMALVVGSVNGYLVTQRRVSPFLATLAVMIVLQGIRFAWTKGAPSGRVPELIRVIGSQAIHSVPINLILLVILAVFVGVMLERTAFGRKIYMVGGNPRAAELVGVNVNWITFLCYVLSAILAALGGLVLVGYVGSVDNWVGRGYELNSIIATVMGGVSLGGGRGSVFGALVGAFVLTEIFNIALLLGFPVQFQWVVKGVVILLAVAVYLAANRSR